MKPPDTPFLCSLPWTAAEATPQSPPSHRSARNLPSNPSLPGVGPLPLLPGPWHSSPCLLATGILPSNSFSHLTSNHLLSPTFFSKPLNPTFSLCPFFPHFLSAPLSHHDLPPFQEEKPLLPPDMGMDSMDLGSATDTGTEAVEYQVRRWLKPKCHA